MSGRVNNTERRRRAVRKNTRKKRGMTIKKKILMTAGIFAVAFVGISVAVINVAHGKGDGYKKKYLAQQTYSSNPIIAKRGDILDRRGVALAKSVLVYNFVLEPKIILANEKDYKDPTIKFVSEYFGISADELKQIIEKNPDSMYQVIKKEISFDEKEKFVAAVNEFNKRDTKKEKEDTAKDMVMGYNFEGYYKRTYP